MFGTREPRTTVVTHRDQLGPALANSDRIVVEGSPDLLNFALGCAERKMEGSPDTTFRTRVEVPLGGLTSEAIVRPTAGGISLPRKRVVLAGAAIACLAVGALGAWLALMPTAATLPGTLAGVTISGNDDPLYFPHHDFENGTSGTASADNRPADLGASNHMVPREPEDSPATAPNPSHWRDPDAPAAVPNEPSTAERVPPEADAQRSDTAPTPRPRATAHRAPRQTPRPDTAVSADSPNMLQAVLQASAWPLVAVIAILCLFALLLVALRTNRDVEFVWKVTEKFEGRVVITKVKTPRPRVSAA